MTAEKTMRQILAELELLSYGTTASWNPGGGGDTDRDPRPAGGDTRPLHETFRTEHARAETPEDRDRVRRAAAAALEAQTKRTHDAPIEEESADQVDQRIAALVRAGWTVKDIAIAARCTPTRVRRVSKGMPVEADEGGEDLALHLASQGHTVRYIAMKTGMPKSTVHDLLRKRAA